MPKTSVDDWSTTAVNNTEINAISIQGSARNSNVDNALREMMKQIADFRDSLDTRFATYFEDQGVYNPLNWPGIVDDGDATAVTAAVNAFYASLPEGSRVDWPPMIVNLDGPICVYTHNIETRFSKGTIFRQKSWGRMVFLTADPEDETVRPNGLSFVGPAQFQAYIDDELAYFYDSLHGPDEAGATEYTVQCETTSTIANLRIVSEGVVWEEGDQFTVTGWGTNLLTITLDVPHAADTYIAIKVTNKYDLYSYAFTPIMPQNDNAKSNESAAIWHGGGNDFTASGFHVEGFVCPVYCAGDWYTDTSGNQSYRIRITDLTFNNVEFILIQEVWNVYIDRIIGGVISETQTPDGSANYKAPHIVYFTNRVTPIQSQNVYIGVLEGTNHYSSLYKVRNINGLTIEAGSALEFARLMDMDGCVNASFHFPTVTGAYDKYKDSRRAALNIFNSTDVSGRVDKLEVVSDSTSVLTMRPGVDEPGDLDNPTVYAVCQRVNVQFGELITEGTVDRGQPWIVNLGNRDCWAHVEHWRLRGADDVYMYRARSSGTDVSPAVGCIGGGFKVDRITGADAHLLNLAQLSAEDATVPANMLVEYSKATARGSITYDASTVLDGGTTNTVLLDGAKYPTFTVVPTFATPGDSTFTVTASNVFATQRGEMVKYWFSITFNVSAYTTASGELRIALNGLPTPHSVFTNWPGAMARWGTIDIGSNVRDLGPLVVSSGGPYVTFRANTDNSTGALINTSDLNSAGATGYVFSASGEYRAA